MDGFGMTPYYLLILGILATWRITHLVVIEAGPWDVFGRLRRAAGSGALAELLGCFYCFSLWTAALFAYWLASTWRHRLLLWPALSAAAILLERLASRGEPAPQPLIFEDQEDHHVLRS
jgi:hypothetical protein